MRQMKLDIMYLKDRDEFYQMTDVKGKDSSSTLTAYRIKRTGFIRTDYMLWNLGEGGTDNYFVEIEECKPSNMLTLRCNRNGVRDTGVIKSIRFRKNKMKIKLVGLTWSNRKLNSYWTFTNTSSIPINTSSSMLTTMSKSVQQKIDLEILKSMVGDKYASSYESLLKSTSKFNWNHEISYGYSTRLK